MSTTKIIKGWVGKSVTKPHGAYETTSITVFTDDSLPDLQPATLYIGTGKLWTEEEVRAMVREMVEAKKWKPKIGQWIKPVDGKWQARVYDGVIAKVKSGPDEHGHYLSDGPEFYFTVDEVRPATPEEVAKYHADQEAAAEAAKPIVFGTRVRKIRDETEWRVACSAPHADGRWLIVNEENFWSEGRKRHEFKVIDP